MSQVWISLTRRTIQGLLDGMRGDLRLRSADQSDCPVVDLSTPSGFAFNGPRPEIAMDAAGAVAVWPQDDNFLNVQAANMAPDGAWGPVVDLEPGTVNRRPLRSG
jgi:hypothetical protein